MSGPMIGMTDKFSWTQLKCISSDQSVAWRSGNALCRINEVALRRARLVLGWVTVYGQVNDFSTKPAS